jgi:hypothetical protein
MFSSSSHLFLFRCSAPPEELNNEIRTNESKEELNIEIRTNERRS